MKMQIINLVQGSEEWKQFRSSYCVASEAAIIMGDSPHMKREELLQLKHTGSEKTFSEWVEKFIFAKGHELEALARPIAEELLGDELYALVGIREVNGLKLLASFDGITAPLYDNHWEHKQFNQALFDLVNSGGELWPEHYWQLEHQMLVNDNSSCIFAVSDGTRENYAQIVYHSVPKRRADLITGWKQFFVDLGNFVPVEKSILPVAALQEYLPAIRYTISIDPESKTIALKSNQEEYKAAVHRLMDRAKKKLETDQDFVDAIAHIKICEDAESKLKVMMDDVLGEFQDIDKFAKDLKTIHDLIRTCRIAEEKQVDSRKAQIKSDAINAIQFELSSYIQEINKRLFAKGVALPLRAYADFTGAIKGLKTIDSMKSSLKDELARAKIEITQVTAKIDKNIHLVETLAPDKGFLFSDLRDLVTRDHDYVELLIKTRIKQHADQIEAKRISDEAEAKRLAEKEEADRQAREIELSAPVAGDNITAADHKQMVAELSAPNSAYARVMHGPTATEIKSKTDYQIGMLDGLDLALAIFMKHGANGFVKAVEDFIESDCIPESPKAAA
jgi:predicted phage-related endonuclease